MRKTNKVTVKVTQLIPASISKNDGMHDEKTIDTEFETQTVAEITAMKLALWFQVCMYKYMNLRKLQREENFRQNRDIVVTITVNGKEETFKQKCTLNIDRLAATFEKSPLLVASVFAPTPSIGSITQAVAMNAIQNGAHMVIAKAIKKQPQTIELPVVEQRLSLTDVELTDADIN